jgi:hypothetical protein
MSLLVMWRTVQAGWLRSRPATSRMASGRYPNRATSSEMATGSAARAPMSPGDGQPCVIK